MTTEFSEALAAGSVKVRACLRCGLHQTLDPIFCVRCGSDEMTWAETSGLGHVYATTQVHLAPSSEYRALLPYTLVLVDLCNGGRLMGHGTSDLAIGTAVRATVFRSADRSLVRFLATEQAP